MAALRGWLLAGAPDEAPPSLPADLPPEELGAMYQRHLLGSRRERGAYYTPRRLVDLLVGAALDPILEESPEGAVPLVLDPACGAGVFLLAAADAVLARLRLWAQRHGSPEPPPTDWIGSLRGTDTDPGAVAVTRLALARKTGAPLSAITGVRCGDALLDARHEEEPVDVVLGNPPFLGEEDHGERFRALRRSALGARMEARADYAYLFVHLALDRLGPGGALGMVLPDALATATGAAGLRRRLAAETRILSFTGVKKEAGARFFLSPGQRSCLVVLRKGAAPDHRPWIGTLTEKGWCASHEAPEQRALLDGGGRFRLCLPAADLICVQMEGHGRRLSESHEISTGIQAGPGRIAAKALRRHLGGSACKGQDLTELYGQGVFVLTTAEIEALGLSEAEQALLRPFYFASELLPFHGLPPARHGILYLTAATCPDLSPYPALARHFERFRALTSQRRETRNGHRTHFQLHWPREERRFLQPKLLSVRQTPRPCFVYAPGPTFVDLAVNVIAPRALAGAVGAFRLPALMAILNSSSVHHYLRHRGKRTGAVLQIDGAPLEGVPIPPYEEGLDKELVGLAMQAGAGDPAAARRRLDERVARAYGLAAVPSGDISGDV